MRELLRARMGLQRGGIHSLSALLILMDLQVTTPSTRPMHANACNKPTTSPLREHLCESDWGCPLRSIRSTHNCFHQRTRVASRSATPTRHVVASLLTRHAHEHNPQHIALKSISGHALAALHCIHLLVWGSSNSKGPLHASALVL